ncbi:C-terminal helicase domain-containing protein, partial [Brucella sp. 22210]|uniref:C-terminal helicase domain-containing protein n=1 Tax=Brucella sp. 22210 TaxID=3453892 RepID=UPI003F8406BA
YDGGVSTLRRLTGMAKAKPASNWIKDWLENNPPDKKLVVFAHHKDVIEQLYDDHHLHAVQVHGHMKQRERQISVDRLQTDPDVRIFIGQITAAGVGLTLT